MFSIKFCSQNQTATTRLMAASPHLGALIFPHAMFWLRLAQSGESPFWPRFQHPYFSHQKSVRYGRPLKPAGEKAKQVVNFLQKQGQPPSQAPSLLPPLPR